MEAGASIINVSSVNGIRPTPNASMYSAAKHALEGLTKSVALESIKSGIRINAVALALLGHPDGKKSNLIILISALMFQVSYQSIVLGKSTKSSMQ